MFRRFTLIVLTSSSVTQSRKKYSSDLCFCFYRFLSETQAEAFHNNAAMENAVNSFHIIYRFVVKWHHIKEIVYRRLNSEPSSSEASKISQGQYETLVKRSLIFLLVNLRSGIYHFTTYIILFT